MPEARIVHVGRLPGRLASSGFVNSFKFASSGLFDSCSCPTNSRANRARHRGPGQVGKHPHEPARSRPYLIPLRQNLPGERQPPGAGAPPVPNLDAFEDAAITPVADCRGAAFESSAAPLVVVKRGALWGWSESM